MTTRSLARGGSRFPFGATVRSVFFLLWLIGYTPLQAQTVCIDTILFEGLRKTRPFVVLRELGLKTGDCLPRAALVAEMEPARLRVMNTSLFTDACMELLDTDSGRVVLVVHVNETWYFIPSPVLEFADRNFNVWWNEFDRSLERVNFGVNLHHGNLTGRRDVLKLDLQFGYTNSIGFQYKLPAFNRKQTLGLTVGASLNKNREVAFSTQLNKPVFMRTPGDWQLRRLQVQAGISWRPRFFGTHSFGFEFRDSHITDSVAEVLNPDFFLHGRDNQRYSGLSYVFVLDRRDWQPYPMRGDRVQIEFKQLGLLPTDDLHLCRIFAEYSRFMPINRRWSTGVSLRGRTSLPRQAPPYFNNQAIGYGGNSVRGYEYYVVDGLDFGVVKTTLRWQILDQTFRLDRVMPFQTFKRCPTKVFLSAGSDWGFANDPHYKYNNPYANRTLWGGGIGLDILAWYDKFARFEWSINDMGFSGFYTSMSLGF